MKKFYSFLVAMLLSVVAFAYDVKIDGIYYNLDEENKTAEVTCENLGEEGNYLGVTSIVIPTKITYNGVVYDVTSIGVAAFFYCASLISIEIPNSVILIEESVFHECLSLGAIKVDENNLNYASVDGVLYSKDKKTLLCCPGGKTEITIPNSVTSIGNFAFATCKLLLSITIPNNVTSIGYFVFAGCESLTFVIIPNSVTTLEEGVFSGCTSLSNITIPNSVTSIGNGSFQFCTSLTTISIPNSVTTIDIEAFYDCSSLATITIPNSVTYIGGNAFLGCSSLVSLMIEAEEPPMVGNHRIFEDEVSRSILIKIPCSSITKYKTAEYWGEFTNYQEEISQNILTVNVNDEIMGVAIVAKRNTCDDALAQVQAQALTGYEFVRWSDGATENPHILLVTEDMTITAEFRKIGEEPEDKPGEDEKHNNFIIESADKTQGNVKITITAEAIEGFEFDHWSDGSTENPRVVTLDEDVELYAYFRVAGTGLENSVISSASVYGNNGVLYVEGAETDYHVLDAAGRLIYTGRVAELSLPRGVYVVNVGGEVQKVVI